MNALLIVDVQNDFVTGSLAVPDAGSIIPVLNRIAKAFPHVVASKDWHPPDHVSHVENHPGRNPGDIVDINGIPQVLWPAHCVQGTLGAEFADGLTVPVHHQIHKGTHPRIDSYSAFFDNARQGDTGLHSHLAGRGVRDLFITGLATDYCVKFTALDAIALGYRVHLIRDATRAVNLAPGDGESALAEMHARGVEITESSKF